MFYGFINFYLLFLFFICIYLLAPPIRPPSSRPPVLSIEWSDEWPYTDIQHLSLSPSLPPSLPAKHSHTQPSLCMSLSFLSVSICSILFLIFPNTSMCYYVFISFHSQSAPECGSQLPALRPMLWHRASWPWHPPGAWHWHIDTSRCIAWCKTLWYIIMYSITWCKPCEPNLGSDSGHKQYRV